MSGWVSQAEEDREYEMGARYDAIRERFAGDLILCRCGQRVVDPAGCCDLDEGVPELPRAGREPVPFVADERPVASDDIPF